MNNTVYFVNKDAIVRKIWGKDDTVLCIFAGAAAEFALHKQVDWLYVTGKLPADPLGRLFSTVQYAKQIIFADEKTALQAIEKINSIHKNVEQQRHQKIPDWAYCDVLSMLIDYSIRAYETLERKLSLTEKAELFKVFQRVGKLMKLQGLSPNFTEWQQQRKNQLQQHLAYSDFTADLFQQYQKHLGKLRFRLVLETQNLLAPQPIRQLLGFKRMSILIFLLPLYRLLKKLNMDGFVKSLLVPKAYQSHIKALNQHPA